MVFASAIMFLSMMMIINNVSTYAQLTPNGLGVRITSPIKDEQIPVGKNNNLKISGTSTDNANVDCQVYVILNNLKPYQKATATGPSGVNDYSKWNFLLNSNYATIKEGVNKITAKLSCIDDPSNNLTKYYSINVTGVKVTGKQQQEQPSIKMTGNDTSSRSSGTTGSIGNLIENQLPLSSSDNNTDNMDKDRVGTTFSPDSDIKSKEHKPDESTKENNNEEKTNPLIIPFGAG